MGLLAPFEVCQTLIPQLPALFWGPKPQFWGSWLCFRGAKPQSLGLSAFFWGSKPQFWGSQLWFWGAKPRGSHSISAPQNAALFWWNLRRNGDGDGDTLHAGCPVLAGDKWGERLCPVSPWGDTGLEGQLHQRGGGRCWEPRKILDDREKHVTDTGAGSERGAGGQRQTGVIVLVPSSGE